MKPHRLAKTLPVKERLEPIGVYVIRNRVNGRQLVAGAINLRARINRARFELSTRIHPNKALQRDWNELGPEAFEFEVLDTLEPVETRPLASEYQEDVDELTRLWIERLGTDRDGYNLEQR
ncbi:hypothetical protein HNR42_000713 [Deinobacterium chartae]|uniref:GIY-YIG nuclease family protein n=1 Tax=Deinobacterium chartae TaxID=521158 RepID=A0A841HYK2_9DEIO|nr:GIY-YIG nuclease family protein [Deinobacterium chartae]MBB6097299.1 hypothetical protein [Deinobacterium chartae]